MSDNVHFTEFQAFLETQGKKHELRTIHAIVQPTPSDQKLVRITLCEEGQIVDHLEFDFPKLFIEGVSETGKVVRKNHRLFEIVELQFRDESSKQLLDIWIQEREKARQTAS